MEKDNNKIEEKNVQNEKPKASLKFVIWCCVLGSIIIGMIAGVSVYFLIGSSKNHIIKRSGDGCDEVIPIGGGEPGMCYKPIIYLYPTEETNVNVKLGNPNNITCSYPKYQTGWDVFAKPNGDLTDLQTGRNLYSLYYESENVVDFNVEKEGFVVKGEDSAKFLEEKLAILGLTEREAEEFIVYWLPKLEANKYNYIRFATEDEIQKNMPLEINPKPDTVIRVLMEYKGLENSIEVQEQDLSAPERNGFTVVEWGGTEIN